MLSMKVEPTIADIGAASYSNAYPAGCRGPHRRNSQHLVPVRIAWEKHGLSDNKISADGTRAPPHDPFSAVIPITPFLLGNPLKSLRVKEICGAEMTIGHCDDRLFDSLFLPCMNQIVEQTRADSPMSAEGVNLDRRQLAPCPALGRIDNHPGDLSSNFGHKGATPSEQKIIKTPVKPFPATRIKGGYVPQQGAGGQSVRGSERSQEHSVGTRHCHRIMAHPHCPVKASRDGTVGGNRSGVATYRNNENNVSAVP